MQSTRNLQFNPLALTADQEELFYSLVSKCAEIHGVTYFAPGKIYSADVDFEIAGNHPFLFRKKQSVPGQFRLDVIGEKINNGMFGKVYHITATLKPFQYQVSHSKRVVKIFKKINAAREEYDIVRFVPHLRMKVPVSYCVDRSPLQAHVMRCFAGVELHEKKCKLTGDGLLVLARNVLFAVKEQAHDIGIVHKDVKAENMIVDDCLRVNLIDYGASHRQEMSNMRVAGTLATMAPEVGLSRGATIKSDIFSAGITLAELFGAADDADAAWSKSALRSKFSSLFKSNPDIGTKHRKCIKKLLLEMCRIDPNDRCDLQHAIKVLELIILERRQASVRKRAQKREYSCAHEAALMSRDLLRLSELRAAHRLGVLNSCIRSDMQLLNPSPAVLEHYLFMLRVDALRVARSMGEALMMVESFVDRYHISMMNVNALYVEYGRLLSVVPSSLDHLAEAREYYQDVTYFMQYKLPDNEKTIDGCISLIHKLEKRYQLMKVHVEYLQAQSPQPNAGAPAMSL